MGTIKINNIEKEASCEEELRAMRDCFFVLGGKWRLQIIRYLSNREDQSLNFTKIQNDLNISPKVLSTELNMLQINAMILRKETTEKMPQVLYQITAYGKQSLPLIEAIVQWGLDHRTKILSL